MKKRKITDNIPLKIMSVAIAVVLWLIVVNIDNPTGTNYYTLNDVELINKEYVESSDTIGKMCMPEQNQDSIKVAITATKKIRDKIKVTDISAVADLQQAVSLDTNPVMVPITVTCSVPGVSPSDIKVTPQNLSVNLDEKETQEFVVNVSRGDTKPGKDYEVGSLTASPEKVTVTAKLWKIRQGVQISADYVGTPAEGYQVGAVRTVPDTISVAGSAEGLESLADNNNVITIPEDSIDISGESEDVEKKISLTNLLPDNVKLTSDSSEDVWVTVSILPAGSREFEFPTKNIEVKNKPKDLQVTFETAQIEVRIKSDNKDLDDLNNDKDIKASIDLDGKKEGSYEVPVEIVLPDGYETVEDVTTEVVISSGTAVDDSKENKE